MRIRDPGWKQFGSRIRDGNNSDPGSGMETIRIQDPGWKQFGSGIPGWKKVGSGILDKHPGSATLFSIDFYVAWVGYYRSWGQLHRWVSVGLPVWRLPLFCRQKRGMFINYSIACGQPQVINQMLNVVLWQPLVRNQKYAMFSGGSLRNQK
jgi:hypothetical protein